VSYDIDREVIYEKIFDPKIECPDFADLLPMVSTRVWATSLGTFEIFETRDDETSRITISKELFEIMKRAHVTT
jgi:hypothetical protein